MLRTAFAALSPAGDRARLSILIFHRVHASPDPLFPDEVCAHRFDAICSWVRSWCHVLPLDEAVQRLAQGSLPPRALSITFDDGYADNQQVALPILRRHGLTATFFIATGFIDGGRMWNDTLIESIRRAPGTSLDLGDIDGLQSLGRVSLDGIAQRRATIASVIGAAKYLDAPRRDALVQRLASKSGAELPQDLMMSSDQVRSLRRAGMQLGAHTVNHPILARIGPETARDEIARGRESLQAMIDAPVELFAYPNGKPGQDYGAEHVDIVRRLGFRAAVSTAWGSSTRASDPLQLARFTPWDQTRLRFGLRLVANLRRDAARGADHP